MKVLILSASVGSGHMRAAQAVEAALRESVPAATVRTVDVLELADRSFRKLYGDGYLGLAGAAPHLLGFLYDALDKPMLGDRLRRLWQSWSLRGFADFLAREPWDVIINTHFLPAELVAASRRRGRLDIPQMTVVTDFEAHRLWANLPCEHFFAASQDGAACLRHWGVEDEAITVSGIPIHPVFSRLPDREACLKSSGLIGDRPLVLQLAGGSGLGPIEEVFSSLLEVRRPLDLVVVTGRNRDARYRLVRRLAPARHRVHILGYTDRMQELLGAADLVVSKPGGLTTAESLACGVPLVVVNPIPGQESRNADYLLENGAGLKANSIPALPGKVEGLLSSPERLSLMRRKAKALGRPMAAFEVAQKVFELAWLGRNRTRAGEKGLPETPLNAGLPDFYGRFTPFFTP
jgi:processive 1,2-diacylglycerol beta-glucosyltransferase